MTSDDSRGGVASVAKACRVLQAFSPTVGMLSVRQVAARSGIPRSTAHELCRTLVAEGILEGSGGGYQLGPLLLELAGQIIERTGLLRATEGVLANLLRAPEQEALLGQLTQGWVVYLDRRSSTRMLPMHSRVGQRAPAHLTGCGKAALSRLPFDDVVTHIHKWSAESAAPLPDLDKLEDELGQARQDGCLASRSFRKGRMSVAAPILDASGRPLGAVSTAGPAGMFTTTVLGSARASVMNAASVISARIINDSRRWATVPH